VAIAIKTVTIAIKNAMIFLKFSVEKVEVFVWLIISPYFSHSKTTAAILPSNKNPVPIIKNGTRSLSPTDSISA